MLRARLASLEEQVRVAQESVAVAQVQLDNTVVRAPFSGVVVAKAAQPGEMISPMSAGGGFTRTGIGTIVDMDSLEIQVDVNEAFINRVKPEQPVEAMLNAYPEWKIPGAVIAIIPTADRSKATVKVRIAIKLKDPRIVPDMGVRVAFLEPPPAQPAQLTAGVLVPAEAVRADGAAGVVFVYANGKVERRSVTLGETISGTGRCSVACVTVSASCCRRRSRSRTAKLCSWPKTVHHEQSRRNPRPDQDLRARPRKDRSAARHQPRHSPGRLRGSDGPVRLGQDHPAQPDRWAGYTHSGQHYGGRSRISTSSRVANWRDGARPMLASCSSSTISCRCCPPSGTWSCRCC